MFSLEMGLPPDPAVIGCHEITHYVQFQQIAGFAWFWNLFGQVYTPQIGLDPWFDEGLAVYYETKLQPGTGRLAWPFWRGAFAAGFAGRRFNGGDLSVVPARLPRRQLLPERQPVRALPGRHATARTSCGS